jgi:hypothetical protein
MEATSARHATSAAAREVMPACPQCGTAMVVRAQWNGGRVAGLYWGCRRAPGCEGTRRIKSPDSVRPIMYDASAQAIFDWESSRDGHLSLREPAVVAPPPATGLRGVFGKLLSRTETADEPEWTPENSSVGHFDALVDHGFVILENRRLSMARALLDDLIVGPSGIFAVERKAWPGQVVTTGDSVFVDGRERVGATDKIVSAAAALDEAIDYELRPLGISVRPAILFENATNKQFQATVDKVIVGGTRGLPRMIRGRAEPVLGPETIVRLAVAADRLLD